MATLETIVGKVLSLPSADCDDAVSWATHTQWTSIKHVELIITIEDEFGVSFSGDEMAQASSVGVLREMLADKGVAG
jgi:acyl carrier protein